MNLYKKKRWISLGYDIDEERNLIMSNKGVLVLTLSLALSGCGKQGVTNSTTSNEEIDFS